MKDSTVTVPKSTYYYSYRPAISKKSSKNSNFNTTTLLDDSTETSPYYSNTSCLIENCNYQFKTASKNNKMTHLYHRHFKRKFDDEFGEMFAIPEDDTEDNLGTLACPDCNYTVEKNLQNLKYHYFTKHGALEKYLAAAETTPKTSTYYSNSSCTTFENCNHQFKTPSKSNKMTHLYYKHFKDKFDEEYGEIFPILLEDTEDNNSRTILLSCPADCNYTVEKNLQSLKYHYFTKHSVLEKYMETAENESRKHQRLNFIPSIISETAAAPKTGTYFSNSSCTFENCNHQFTKTTSQSNKMTHLYYKHFKEKFDEEYGEMFAILLDKEEDNFTV